MRRAPFLLIPITLAALAHNGPAHFETYIAERPAVIAPADSSFAALVERLSEPGGYFDSDNLISNEASYLHVLGALRRIGVRGGAYVGVGPDQSFSYIAEIEPEVAFIIDIRRDNLLHHLLFKSVFANARNRLEYLCLLFARAVPADIDEWEDEDLADIVEYIDLMPPDDAVFEQVHARILTTIDSFGLPLSDTDRATIRRFHGIFHAAGPGLRFTSRGRAPRSYYPTYRDLLLETDLEGNPGNYLADEERFRRVQRLQNANRVVPVVGDLAGDHALAAVGHEIERRGLVLSALYTSNVEYYLMLDRSFGRYATTLVGTMPFDDRSVIIRSFFGRGWPHPQNVRGYYATQLVEPLGSFVQQMKAGGYTGYADLVSQHIVENR